MNDYYSLLGPLVLGSRFRKMSERMLAEISGVYKTLNIDFEPGWFHLLYLLRQHEELAITQVSEMLGVAHPSVIQVLRVLESKELVHAFPGKKDKRKRILRLTDKGRELVLRLDPVWEKIRQVTLQAMSEGEHSKYLLEAMTELEKNLLQKSLAERMKER